MSYLLIERARMTPEQFQSSIDALGYSQVGISRLFGVTDRTGRRWASGDVSIPKAVEMVLLRMQREGLTVEVQARILAGRLGSDFGPRDQEQYVWVRPKSRNGTWQVARRDNSTKLYYLTGNELAFKLDELELGPIVHLDIPDQEGQLDS